VIEAHAAALTTTAWRRVAEELGRVASTNAAACSDRRKLALCKRRPSSSSYTA
jgi:hypothetical protein